MRTTISKRRITARSMSVMIAGALIFVGLPSAIPAFAADEVSPGLIIPTDPGWRLQTFALPNPLGLANDVVAGAGGTVWVSVFADKQVIQLNHDGVLVATAQLTGAPSSLATDGEGGVWAAELASNTIAHITASAVPREYKVPTLNSFPSQVYDSGDQVFFTESNTQKLGRLTESTGAIDEFLVAGASTLWSVTGIDDQVWVTDTSADVTWILDRNGTKRGEWDVVDGVRALALSGVSEESVTHGFATTQDGVYAITRDSDGSGSSAQTISEHRWDIQGFANVGDATWFVDAEAGTISKARITPSGPRAATFAVGAASDGLSKVAVTDQRWIWSLETKTGKIIRLDSLAAVQTPRYGGADRYEMAANLSYESSASRVSDVVFVVSGEKFPDALSAGPIAAAAGAPILLTTQNSLPASTMRELIRQDAHRVVVVGGPASVSPSVFDAIKAAVPHAKVERIEGADRYAVSRALLKSDLAPHKSVLYIANGQNFPDALSSGPAAARFQAPLLLVNGTGMALSSEEMAIVSSFSGGAGMVKIAGGPASVSPQIMTQLAAAIPVQRFGGADRYEVSQAINADAFDGATSAYFANGASFPDALAGGPIAARTNSPLYLTHGDCVPPIVLERIANADDVYLLGGTNSLSDNVAQLRPCV